MSLSEDELEFYSNLSDRSWRLRNLYYIKDKHGRKTLFKPNWAQSFIESELWFFSVILKARQLGMTTFFCIFFLDQILWSKNKKAGIIAHKKDDAAKFFKDKIKFAWDNLDPRLKDYLGPPDTNTSGELSFPNGGLIFVSTSTRSGTIQFLHISEFGKLCAQYPGKADEIVKGSINSVEQGNMVTIESTAEGRSGHFFDICESAQQAAKDRHVLSPLEFKFFFFPWWKEPGYRLKSTFAIPREFADYFKNLKDKHNIPLDEEQKRWYIAKSKTNGREGMYQEYPSTPEEAFQASIEGAYYATQMAKVYETNRIQRIPYDGRLPVDTWWDLGMNDTNVILFTQAHGTEIRFIDMYYNSGEGLGHYVNVLKEKGYVYGTHYFPHDVNVRNLDEKGATRADTLRDLGVKNMRVVERTKDINMDIELVRRLFPRFYIDEVNCQALVSSLNSYRKAWDDKLGEFKDYPLHDKHSHIVDPLRILARAWNRHGVDQHSSGGQAQTEDFF